MKAFPHSKEKEINNSGAGAAITSEFNNSSKIIQFQKQLQNQFS